MARITKADLDRASQRVAGLLFSLGFVPEGASTEFRHGSQINGVSYTLVIVAEDGRTPAPGTGYAGHLGTTIREASATLETIERTLRAVSGRA